MICLALVLFLVGSFLTRVTASESGLTGTPVRVTPVDGTHLSFDYKQSVNIEDYSQLEKVIIDIDVSIIRKISHTYCRLHFQGGEITKIDDPKKIKGDPIKAEWDVCKSATIELQIRFHKESQKSRIYVEEISYDPLVYIEKNLKACMEDNLVINVDEENALRSCFSEDSIQMFYISDRKEVPLKIGSNSNITQENIKENLDFKITKKEEKREFSRKTEDCEKQVTESPVIKAANTSVAIGIVFGSIGLLVVAVICVTVYRRKKMKNNPDSDLDDFDDGDDQRQLQKD